MTRRMLINAQNPEELRIAIVDGVTLESFQLEAAERGLTRGNIYRGIVNNLQPSLNAAFIDYGGARDGFLSVDNVVEQVWHRHPDGVRRPRVEQVLERGKPVLVQVSKDPEGQKGAALTTNVSLAGRYLVLTPYDDTRGVSRKVEDEDMRQRLKDQVEKMKLPPGGGFIVRTNALEQTKTTMTRDFSALLRVWKKIETESHKGHGPRLLYNDQDIIVRALRDYLDATVAEVVIDDEGAFNKASEYIASFMPRGKMKLVRYSDRVPLFTRYDIETQIDRIYDRKVPLPAGGSIVIDRTEALVAIDVNSGKATRGASQEETAVHVNLEAAREVARQLRLRDIGGLVVVDFIDMRHRKDRAQIEKTLKEALKSDKARTSVGAISPNGLLEINRQRIQQALHLRTHRPCPTCDGTGRIASPEMVSINLLRRIEARAASGSISGVRIALHPELADAFQNHRRADIAALEEEFGIQVEVIASYRLHRPEQELEWVPRAHAETRPAAVQEKPTAAPAPRAAAPALPHSPATPAAAPEGGRARKRRRGRKRRGGEDHVSHETHGEPATGFEPRDTEAPEAAAEPEAAPQQRSEPARKRRSRRGGRKHRGAEGAHSENESPVAESAARPLDGEAAEPAAHETPDEAPQPAGETVRKRKSRRGGRKRHATTPAEATGDYVSPWIHDPADIEALPPHDDVAEHDSGESRDVPAATSAPDGAASKRRRARRGGRRRRGGAAGETPPAGSES